MWQQKILKENFILLEKEIIKIVNNNKPAIIHYVKNYLQELMKKDIDEDTKKIINEVYGFLQ